MLLLLSGIGRIGADEATTITFSEAAAASGLTAEVTYGPVGARRYVLESTGTGVAVFDYDNDGRPDVFVVNGSRLELKDSQAPPSYLFHNLGQGRFEDVTAHARVAHRGWGQAACVGDYNGDGRTDLFVTSYGAAVLYRNRGDGTFEDVTHRAGIRLARRWNAGCAFLDHDRDGDLDLFVANYLDYPEATALEPGIDYRCFWKGAPVFCGPRGLKKGANALLANRGDGSFADVSRASGIAQLTGSYSFMPITLDFDGDGWLDIYVACDASANMLLHNLHDGTFRDVALEAGAAFDENGREQASMGVAAGDYDDDGNIDLLVTNFEDETPTLYRNARGAFEVATRRTRLSYNSREVSWGVGFADFDNDGWKDILIASGHVYPSITRQAGRLPERQPTLVYRNVGGLFEDITGRAGAAVQEPKASRGAAFEDLDGDGDVDVVLANVNASAAVLRNDTPAANHWLILQLEGSRSNRSAIGALVRVEAGGRLQADEVRSGSSFYSSNGLRLHFGVGSATVANVAIRWPSGQEQRLDRIGVDRVMVVRETR